MWFDAASFGAIRDCRSTTTHKHAFVERCTFLFALPENECSTTYSPMHLFRSVANMLAVQPTEHGSVESTFDAMIDSSFQDTKPARKTSIPPRYWGFEDEWSKPHSMPSTRLERESVNRFESIRFMHYSIYSCQAVVQNFLAVS